MYNSKLVKGSDIEKNIRNKDNFVIIEGESGIGKTTFIQAMSKRIQESYGDKLKIWQIGREVLTDEVVMGKRVNEILDDYRKQIIVIDNAEIYFNEAIEMIQKIYSKEDPRQRPEMSYCLAVSTNGLYSEGIRFRSRVLQYGLQVIICQIMPVDTDDIRSYMMKSIEFHNYTDKKNLVTELIG